MVRPVLPDETPAAASLVALAKLERERADKEREYLRQVAAPLCRQTA